MSKPDNKPTSGEIEKLQADCNQLQEVNQNLNQQLIRLNQKLKDAESMKSHFISNIMNELVNPFASVLGLAQSIMSLNDVQISKARSLAKLIYQEAYKLEFQLNNIFMAARIEAGEATLDGKKVKIRALCESILDQFALWIEKKSLVMDFQYQEEPSGEAKATFVTDPEKLKIVLINLLDNAIKFSPEKGVISFHVHHQPSKVIFRITDQGKGMDSRRIPDIYDRFKQLDSGIHTSNSGYGLGLSVSAALIDLMGGRLNISSQEKKGTESLLSIPQLKEYDDDTASDMNEIFFTDESF